MPSTPHSTIEPGQWVRHPGRPDWGPGQVQSVIGARVTVNFLHAGKVLVNTMVIVLDICDEPPD
jgi:FKBP-type peptidyl-prolyl cis-trans isomerase 2